MKAYIHYESDGSYIAFRLGVADQRRHMADASLPHFPHESAMRVAFAQQLCAWPQLRMSWRHLFEKGETVTYLLVKAQQRMTEKTVDVILGTLNKLVALTPVTDANEFVRVRNPYGRRAYITEIRQDSIEVSFAAGKVIGEELVAILPFMHQPNIHNWDVLAGSLARAGASVMVNTLLIATEFSAEEVTECQRIVGVADNLTYYVSRNQQVHDMAAEKVAQVFAALPQRLSSAIILVVQVVSPSKEVSQNMALQLAARSVPRSDQTIIPSGFMLQKPQNQNELDAARVSLEDLKFVPWGEMLVPPGLSRLPYLTDAHGASALVHIPHKGIMAQVGAKQLTVKGDLVMGDQKKIDLSGSTITGSNLNVNIDSKMGKIVQTIRAAPKSDDTNRQQLESLIQQLTDALKQVPQVQTEDAEVVTELTQELVDAANKPQPNQKMLEIKGENLKQAAENLKAVAPIILSIATQIVGHILKLGIG